MNRCIEPPLAPALGTLAIARILFDVRNHPSIEETLLMGADYYESPAQREDHLEHGTIPLGVGAHTTIRHAIIDKNARIGRQVRIVNHAQVQEADQEALGFVIRNGIVVVIKNATIPDGMVI
jgi:glucose-1-phosphate adenylyltransferase